MTIKFARFHTTNRKENFFCTDKKILDFPLLFFSCQFECDVITSGEEDVLKIFTKISAFRIFSSPNPWAVVVENCICAVRTLSTWLNSFPNPNYSLISLVSLFYPKRKRFMTLLRSKSRQQFYMPWVMAIKLSFDWPLRVFGRFIANWKKLHGFKCKTSDGVVGTWKML